jgi:serine/threonine-protein kinase
MAASALWKTDWFLAVLVCAPLFVAYLLWQAKRRRQRSVAAVASPAEQAQNDRMFGLASQGQGKLDEAFARFRRCPLDAALLETLYKLALDFERQAQPAKALEVYQYLHAAAPTFRDVAARLQPKSKPAAALPQTPQFGPFRLGKKLGKGAMGDVYLGRDIRDDRPVAIKTLALSREFDPDVLQEVKGRFFREAETAGRLQHPNIVAIYETGEIGELAYLAMEYLPGQDLRHFAKPDSLLPLVQVIPLVAAVAEALDYAHARQVVHRDIKPANIMYELKSGVVKVMDFGIARLTDIARTRTGMVLGTPSYMSPEQLAGRKVDGRSDLYSLGVTLYLLCSGQLPFVAETLGQLMAKISQAKAADILSLNPALPLSLKAVIEQAMQKDPALRYQYGADMAAALRACLAEVGQ